MKTKEQTLEEKIGKDNKLAFKIVGDTLVTCVIPRNDPYNSNNNEVKDFLRKWVARE
jgi:hypothetical protein